MELTSAIHRVTAIKKATKAKFFEDVRVGDEIRVSMALQSVTRYGGLYATCVTATNLTQGTSAVKSQTEMAQILDRCFELGAVGTQENDGEAR